MAAASMLSLTSPHLVTAILCPEVKVIEKKEVIELTVMVDMQGRPIAQYDGATITKLSKRYGFGSGKKANDACRAWIASVGVKDSQWVSEPVAHTTMKLPIDLVKQLDDEFISRGGDRQKLIGELW
jgi:hypothetical protein